MGCRCTLCLRWMEDRQDEIWCECGWTMDERCNRNHHPWCPVHGEDRWIGTVEI